MSEKREIAFLPEVSKRPRKAIDLDMKMRIIQYFDDGRKVKAISRDLGLAHSTVSTILKDKERIREAAKTSAGYKAIITRQRKGLIHETEKLLSRWIEEQQQKQITLTHPMIQTEALRIFEMLKQSEGEECTKTFIASKGWLHRFRRRFNFNNSPTESTNFVNELDKLITEGDYLPEQIFNVDETCLYWKKIPKEEENGEKVTLLLGGNVAGFKLKPLLINNTEMPNALRHIKKEALPVCYRANSKALMTQTLFTDWLRTYFIPVARQYCLDKGVPFKLLLIIDNAANHSPQQLNEVDANVKVVHMPTDVTTQPMEQGAISVFKAYYLITTFSKAISATASGEQTIYDFWRSYNLLQCIKHIGIAWENVSVRCMQGIWKKCLKRFVNNEQHEAFSELEEVDSINRNIVELARALNLDVDVEDVENLVEYAEAEVTHEDLMELEAEEERNDERMEEVQEKFTLKGLGNVLTKVNEILVELEDMDQNVERFTNAQRQINNAMSCYREIYDRILESSPDSHFIP